MTKTDNAVFIQQDSNLARARRKESLFRIVTFATALGGFTMPVKLRSARAMSSRDHEPEHDSSPPPRAKRNRSREAERRALRSARKAKL